MLAQLLDCRDFCLPGSCLNGLFHGRKLVTVNLLNNVGVHGLKKDAVGKISAEKIVRGPQFSESAPMMHQR